MENGIEGILNKMNAMSEKPIIIKVNSLFFHEKPLNFKAFIGMLETNMTQQNNVSGTKR